MEIDRERYLETSDLSWFVDANCKSKDTDYMFPHNGVGVTLAKQVCSNCVVKIDCLEYALRLNIEHGVWGNTSERERRNMRRGKKAPTEL